MPRQIKMIIMSMMYSYDLWISEQGIVSYVKAFEQKLKLLTLCATSKTNKQKLDDVCFMVSTKENSYLFLFSPITQFIIFVLLWS